MPITAADLLAYYYGQPLAQHRAGYEEGGEVDRPYGAPGFPNLDPRAYFRPPEPGTGLGNFASQAPWALLGLGARPAPTGPAARALNMDRVNPRRPDGSLGDDSVAQHVYEAMLGRTRRPGEAVASPNSGWWTWGPIAIPKPSNPLPIAAAGAVGYGLWNAMGGPQAWHDLRQGVRNERTPGTPEYEERQGRLNAYMDRVNTEPSPGGDFARLLNYGPSLFPNMSGSRGVPVLPDAPY